MLPEATGFVWKRRDRHYLITNWHVASATHLFTKKLLRNDGCRPNVFRCHFIIRIAAGANYVSRVQQPTRAWPYDRCGRLPTRADVVTRIKA
jgi:hypothetical protein